MVVGIRTHSRPVMRTVTRAQRAWLNPRALKTAGQPGEYAVIRHVGRKSGNRYETPVGVVAVEDTFLIALPYGTTPDWLKNVMAAGSAELVHEGETVSVDDPRVVAMKHWLHLFPRADQRAQRVFGVDQALILRRAEPA